MQSENESKTIKMIVTDLDGTLLRDDMSISDHTKTVLNECRSAGIKLAFATGRSTAGRVAPQELFDGRITSNGALAKAGEMLIYDKRIPYKTSRPVLTACDDRGIKIAFNAGGTHYSNFDMSEFWPWIAKSNFHIIDFSQHELFAEKLFIPDCSAEDKEFIEQLIPSGLYSVVTSDSSGDFLQIMHKEATKGQAVLALARHWVIHPSEIAALGNDLNDIDMLTSAGYGLAVENALDEVKAAAKYTCGSNEADGVAKWISDNVLK